MVDSRPYQSNRKNTMDETTNIPAEEEVMTPEEGTEETAAPTESEEAAA